MRHESETAALREELDKERKERIRLEDENQLLKLKAEQAEREAMLDDLTGVFNRKGFKKAIETLSSNDNEDMSIMILDIDNFKTINDTYGHRAGDTVLKAVSEYLSSRVRKSDIIARWGGEEFVIVFRKIHAQKAINKFYTTEEGERLEKPHIEVPVAIIDKEGVEHAITVTFSGGVTEFKPGDHIQEAVGEADGALYEAKSFGKNILKKAS